MYCKICGDVVRGKNFCTSCGHPVKIPVKKQAKSSKWIFIPIAVATALLAAIGSLYFFVLHDSHSNLDARIMSVFRVDGDTVSMQRAGGASTDAREGVGLHAGYVVSTGIDSFCYIRLDAASIVKMDMRTDVSIAQLTDRLLRINIDRGQVLVDLQWQAPEHELEPIAIIEADEFLLSVMADTQIDTAQSVQSEDNVRDGNDVRLKNLVGMWKFLRQYYYLVDPRDAVVEEGHVLWVHSDWRLDLRADGTFTQYFGEERDPVVGIWYHDVHLVLRDDPHWYSDYWLFITRENLNGERLGGFRMAVRDDELRFYDMNARNELFILQVWGRVVD